MWSRSEITRRMGRSNAEVMVAGEVVEKVRRWTELKSMHSACEAAKFGSGPDFAKPRGMTLFLPPNKAWLRILGIIALFW
jgi:hypothetical protein